MKSPLDSALGMSRPTGFARLQLKRLEGPAGLVPRRGSLAGYPNSWRVDKGKSIYTWMIRRGTRIYGNPHIFNIIHTWFISLLYQGRSIYFCNRGDLKMIHESSSDIIARKTKWEIGMTKSRYGWYEIYVRYRVYIFEGYRAYSYGKI